MSLREPGNIGSTSSGVTLDAEATVGLGRLFQTGENCHFLGRPTRRRGAAAAVSKSQLWRRKGSDVIQKAGDASFTVCSQASSQKQPEFLLLRRVDRVEGRGPSMQGQPSSPPLGHMHFI